MPSTPQWIACSGSCGAWDLAGIGGAGRGQLGHDFDLHVAMLQLRFVVLLEQDGAISRMIAASLGKMPPTSARRLTSLLSRSSGLVLCNLLRCGSGKSR